MFSHPRPIPRVTTAFKERQVFRLASHPRSLPDSKISGKMCAEMSQKVHGSGTAGDSHPVPF